MPGGLTMHVMHVNSIICLPNGRKRIYTSKTIKKSVAAYIKLFKCSPDQRNSYFTTEIELVPLLNIYHC